MRFLGTIPGAADFAIPKKKVPSVNYSAAHRIENSELFIGNE
jgi:hypothetical protein